MKKLIIILTGIFSAFLICFIVMVIIFSNTQTKGTDNKPNKENITTESSMENKKETLETPINNKIYELQDISSTWEKVSQGQTVLDGILWLPEVQFTVKNSSNRELKKYFRVLFIDGNTISGQEVWHETETIPPGYSKGPMFFQGTVGYRKDAIFLDMLGEDNKKWKADIFEGDKYDGPWKKIKTITIDLPEPFKSMEPKKDSQANTAEPESIDVKGIIDNYEIAMIKAINENNFSIVENYLYPDSEFYNSQKKLVENLNNKGITEELISYKTQSIKNQEDGGAKALVQEVTKIKYSSGKTQTLTFNWVYSIKTTDIATGIYKIEKAN